MTQPTATAWALAALVAAFGIWAIRRMEPGQGSPFYAADDGWMPEGEDTMPDQLPGTIEATWNEATDMVAESVWDVISMTPATDTNTAQRNERAFLDMIAYSEGTAGPNGYRTLFGGTKFDSFADHPRQSFQFTNKARQNLRTTAAGRYQFLSRTWDDLVKKLDLPDFGPESQDRAALELIRQRGALRDVQAGRIQTAIAKVAPIWASLPGAGYNQPERKLSNLLASYAQAGGQLEATA